MVQLFGELGTFECRQGLKVKNQTVFYVYKIEKTEDFENRHHFQPHSYYEWQSLGRILGAVNQAASGKKARSLTTYASSLTKAINAAKNT